MLTTDSVLHEHVDRHAAPSRGAGVTHSGPLFLAVTLLIAFVALATPAQAQTQLVSNFAQTLSGVETLGSDTAQNFTTGGHANGYTVTAIEVGVRSNNLSSLLLCPTFESRFSRVNSSIEVLPVRYADCTELTRSTTSGSRRLRFSAPAGTVLAANTTYAVVIRPGSNLVRIDRTRSDAEDAGGSPGWSIHFGYRVRIPNGRWSYYCLPKLFPLTVFGTQRSSGSAEQSQAAGVEGVPKIGEPGLDREWTTDEEITVTLNWNEAVTVDTTGGIPTIGLLLGGSAARRASYVGGSVTSSLVFTYRLAPDDGAQSAILVAPSSLALNGGTIRSSWSGFDAALAHEGAGRIVAPPADDHDASEQDGFRAWFIGLPDQHDGSSAFTFELRFSIDPVVLHYRQVRDELLVVAGGRITYVRRITHGRSARWQITLVPSHDGDLTITLPARACAELHGVCFAGEPLAEAVTATLPGPTSQTPPTISATPVGRRSGRRRVVAERHGAGHRHVQRGGRRRHHRRHAVDRDWSRRAFSHQAGDVRKRVGHDAARLRVHARRIRRVAHVHVRDAGQPER